VAVRVVMSSCSDSGSAGHCKLAEAANLSAYLSTYQALYDEARNSGNGRVSGAFTITPGRAIQGVYLFFRKAAQTGTVTVTLEENTGTWTQKATSGALTISTTFGSSLSYQYIPFSTPYTATANQFRIKVLASVVSEIYWLRDTTAGNYAYAVVTDGDDAAGVADGDTVLVDRDVVYTQDVSRTFAASQNYFLVVGTGASYLVPNPAAPITVTFPAGRILQAGNGVVRFGTLATPLAGGSVTLNYAGAAAAYLFETPYRDALIVDTPANVANPLEIYGATTPDLRITCHAAAAGQAVVGTVADIPVSWQDGDTIKLVGKATQSADAVEYTATLTGPRELTLHVNLNVDLAEGAAAVNLSLAQRALGLQVISTSLTILQPTYYTYYWRQRNIIRGVYFQNCIPVLSNRVLPAEVEGVVVKQTLPISTYAVHEMLWAGNDASYENVHVVSTQTGTLYLIQGNRLRIRNWTLQGCGMVSGYSNGGVGTFDGSGHDAEDLIVGHVLAATWAFSFVVSGYQHSYRSVRVIGSNAAFSAVGSTVARYSQDYSGSSAAGCCTALFYSVGSRFRDCTFGGHNVSGYDVGPSNAGDGFWPLEVTLTDCVVGARGIAPASAAVPGSYMLWHNYNGTVGDHRAQKREATFTTEAPGYTNLVQTQQSATETGEHQFGLLSQEIGGQQLRLVVTGQMDAAYYAGTFTLPRVDIYTDGNDPTGTADATAALPLATDAAQEATVAFTPTLDNRQIVLAFRTVTDQVGAAVRWSDVRIVRRQWGYRFEEFAVPISETLTYPVAQITTRVANPFVTLSEAEAGALTGIAYDGATITQTESHTVSEIYQYFQWWAAQSANIGSTVPFDTEDGTNFTCAADYVLDGCTLSGSGAQKIIQLGAHTYSRINDGATDGVVFIGAAGTHVTIALSGIVAGSTVQVYDVTASAELHNNVLASTSLNVYFTHTGSDHSIRIRVRKADYLPWETTGSLTVNGMTIPVNQTANPIYAQTGVDGTTVTEFSFDGAQIKIFIDDPDASTTVQRLIAWYCAAISSTAFIGLQDANLTTPSAQWAQLLNGIQIKNLDASPVVISGGNLTDGSNDPSGIVDLTGGPVFMVSASPAANVMDMAAAAALAVWDEPVAGHTDAGSAWATIAAKVRQAIGLLS
jgi:hypothetical protein